MNGYAGLAADIAGHSNCRGLAMRNTVLLLLLAVLLLIYIGGGLMLHSLDPDAWLQWIAR